MKIQGREIKALLFDMDGTMLDSMGMWYDIDVAFYKRHNKIMPPTIQQEIEGLSFTETAIYIKEKEGLTESIQEIMDEWDEMAYEQYEKHVQLKKCVRETLDLARQNGLLLGIGTSNSLTLAHTALKAHQLSDYFSCVLTSKEVPKGKPAPDIYLQLARNLGVSPKECIVFEDLPAGLMAGNAAGMFTVAVEDSYSRLMRKEKMELADLFIEDFEQWIRIMA